jgi:hypothetical protein
VAVLLPAKPVLAAVPFLEWPVAEAVRRRLEPVVAVDDFVPQVAARALAEPVRRLPAAASELLMEQAVLVSATEAVVASRQVAAPVRPELATDAATALAWWGLADLAQHLRRAAASELLMEQAVLVSATEAVAASRRAADRVRPELATDAAAGLA